MKFSTFCTIVSILGMLFAIAFLFAPAQMAAQYGIRFDAAGIHSARLGAGALGAISVVNWLVRKLDPTSAGARAALIGGLFYNLVSLIENVISTMNGVTNSTAWSTVVINGVILIGIFAFLSKKKASV